MKMLVLGKIDISSLIKAFDTFERFYPNQSTEQEKAGIIQAFEFSYELAWKTLKRVAEVKGIQSSSPRDTFRVAADLGLIQDAERWFRFIYTRNETVRTYKENVVQDIFRLLPEFRSEMQNLVKTLESLG